MKSTQKKNTLFATLKTDHRRIKDLLAEIEETSERSENTRKELYATLREEVKRHSHGEEKGIYPCIMEEPKTKDIGFESMEEHGVVDFLLKKIDHTPVTSPKWMALLTVLKESLQHHIKEEEGILFPKMQKAFSAGELETLRHDFLDAKESWLEKFTNVALGTNSLENVA